MDYYIKNGGEEIHIFYDKNYGLVMKRDVPERICEKSGEAFGVYANGEGIHVICVSKENEILYLLINAEKITECKLCGLNEKFRVEKISISECGGRKFFLCSAEYGKERLLIHCVLGNNAMPSVIDKTADGYFFLFGDRVYYTDIKGVLGFQELADGKPDRFIPIAENGYEPYLCICGGIEYMVYRQDDAIYVNNIPKIKDEEASYPIITERGGEPMLMWHSGAVIKYVGLEKRSGIKRLISSGEQKLICICGENIFYDYRKM